MQTHVHTWFSADRAHVELYVLDGSIEESIIEESIIEFCDEEVFDEIADGMLNPADWHGSLLAYAKLIGALK